MKNFYYIDVKGYPVTYESKTGVPLDSSHKEFTLVDGVYKPEEFRVAEEKRVADELAIKQSEEDSNARKASMLYGDIYNLNGVGYKVSFTKDDGDGLVQVKSAFELGLTNTIIHFDNGTNMPISSSEFSAFASWFVTKRNEFFV